MKIMIIDPWGTEGPGKYLNGLLFGVSKQCETTLITNYYFKKTTNADAIILKCFFSKTENMKNSVYRKIVRGIEYIIGYKKVLQLLKIAKKTKPYDVVHINWLLMYPLDVIFLSKIHKYCQKIIYTAHNVIPHTNGEKSIEQLRRIYEVVDRVIVHGEDIKNEFIEFFPEYNNKLYVQKHGADINPNVRFNINIVEDSIRIRIEKAARTYLFNGRIFYNKGVDRLLELWDCMPQDHLLVVAGSIGESYKELDREKERIKDKDNIIFLDRYIEENLLNYLIFNSSILLLPYRHASMTGVVFTASDFNKTILTTDVGAIASYVNNNVNAFVCQNNDYDLKKKLLEISTIPEEHLIAMGKKLHEHIEKTCSWETIGNNLKEYVYK